MNTVLAEAHARKRVVQEYEGKMLEMEKTYQDRMREEVRLASFFLSLFALCEY
jgi:hypothetical protein